MVADLVVANIGPILLAIAVVLIARPLAVVPIVGLLERVARIPHVGFRNQAVLIWGGLRGGVALALALALPETLPQRDMFVAMTAGVVLATLLVNATTIQVLVRRLGLDEPSREDRFLAASAHLLGVKAARERVEEFGLEEAVVSSQLDEIERSARADLEALEITEEEEFKVVTLRGLYVEREVYQELSDDDLLPPSVTRLLLHEVDNYIEEVSLVKNPMDAVRRRQRGRFDRLVQRFSSRLPRPLGDDPVELARAEASARRLGARHASEALDLLGRLPNIEPAPIERAKEMFARWEREAVASLDELESEVDAGGRELHRRRVETLSRFASTEALQELSEAGLLPEEIARRAARVFPSAKVGT